MKLGKPTKVEIGGVDITDSVQSIEMVGGITLQEASDAMNKIAVAIGEIVIPAFTNLSNALSSLLDEPMDESDWRFKWWLRE